jgi:uncharacterized protein (TIGR02145 family)
MTTCLFDSCEKFGREYTRSQSLGLNSLCDSANSCVDQILPGIQGLCPEGWRIPQADEWTILSNWAGLTNLFTDGEWGRATRINNAGNFESHPDTFGFSLTPTVSELVNSVWQQTSPGTGFQLSVYEQWGYYRIATGGFVRIYDPSDLGMFFSDSTSISSALRCIRNKSERPYFGK